MVEAVTRRVDNDVDVVDEVMTRVDVSVEVDVVTIVAVDVVLDVETEVDVDVQIVPLPPSATVTNEVSVEIRKTVSGGGQVGGLKTGCKEVIVWVRVCTLKPTLGLCGRQAVGGKGTGREEVTVI